jgi:hypothetical protein
MMHANRQRLMTSSPTATMIPFPFAKRAHAVGRLAARVASARTAEKAEGVLAVVLRKQRATMARKGVGLDKIERECRALEAAVRTRVWSLILSPTPTDAA